MNIFFDNIRILILVSLCFLSLEPYYIWNSTWLLPVLAILYIILTFFSARKTIGVLSFLPLFLLFYFLIPKPIVFYEFKIQFSISVFFLIFFIYENSRIKLMVFKYFVNLMAVLMGLGILFYGLHYMIDLPFWITPSRNIVLIQEYKNYLFFVEAINDIDLLPRFRFIFDEAGVVGTICFYLLLLHKYKINRWQTIIFLIGGIISFSLFFYVASLIILLIQNINSVKRIIVISVSLSFLFILLINSPKFNDLILLRFINLEELIGENRTMETFNYSYEKLLKSNQKYLGKGMGAEALTRDRDASIASYKSFLYDYGIIGIILTSFLFYKFLRKDTDLKNTLIILIGVALCFYQRPWIFHYYNTILIFSGVIYYNFKGISKSKSKKTGRYKFDFYKGKIYKGKIKSENNKIIPV